MERYCDANPACGPTNSETQLVGAIESTGLVGEIKRFYFDALARKVGVEKMCKLLLEDCEVFQPDLILYSALGGLLGYQLNPTDAALNEIRRRGIKVYTCLWDTEGREWETWERWLPTVDGVLIIDTVVRQEYYRGEPRIIQAYSAIEPKHFHNKSLQRDINVSFVGGMDGERWPQRMYYINFLKANGVNVVAVGGQRAKRLSWEEYAGFLQKSKISLSFTITDIMCRTLDGRMVPRRTSQLKGRVFETLSCGALLMEDDGYQTGEFFEPGRDYVVFRDDRDLLEKIRYYLKHDEEREAIARSGCQKVTSIYNARNMWGHLFGRMGFKTPDDLAIDENFKKHEEKMKCLSLL
jgi:hypothetical protein